MSIITAICDKQENVVWLGGNGRASIGSFVAPSLDKKWVSFDGWAIGITGSGPKTEALQACSDEFPKNAQHPFEIVKFMREAYGRFDIGEMDEGVKRYTGSGILVHKTGAIWDFDNSFCLTEVERGVFWARGSGMDAAIGAAKALESFVSSHRARMQKTLEIVIETDVDCPGEIVIQSFDAQGVLSEPTIV